MKAGFLGVVWDNGALRDCMRKSGLMVETMGKLRAVATRCFPISMKATSFGKLEVWLHGVSGLAD